MQLQTCCCLKTCQPGLHSLSGIGNQVGSAKFGGRRKVLFVYKVTWGKFWLVWLRSG